MTSQTVNLVILILLCLAHKLFGRKIDCNRFPNNFRNHFPITFAFDCMNYAEG